MNEITFSFGRNWEHFAKNINESSIKLAEADLINWIGKEQIQNKIVLDVGSGSGLHSYCFYRLGASKIISFDYDLKSVETTRAFKEKAGNPPGWTVVQGSILEPHSIADEACADIVYSWGVLHHTGNMWKAIENAAKMVKPEGLLFISIYAKGPRYMSDLALKKKYNSSSSLGKKIMTWKYIWNRIIKKRIKKGKNPFTWNERKERGMNVYHDVIDWLGGLPYEVAHEHELTQFLTSKNFEIVKKAIKGEGACHRLLYRRTA